MAKSFRWYEKLFYKLMLRERICFKLVFYLIVLLVICQGLLIHPLIRKQLVLLERFEGHPVKFYKSLRGDGL